MAPKTRSGRIAKAQPKPIIESSDEAEEGEFEVEEILGKRVVNGIVSASSFPIYDINIC